MKKIYRLENLDCANCAAKMERNILKLEGVKQAFVNFISLKMMIEADDDKFDLIMEEVTKICKKVEPDIKIIG